MFASNLFEAAPDATCQAQFDADTTQQPIFWTPNTDSAHKLLRAGEHSDFSRRCISAAERWLSLSNGINGSSMMALNQQCIKRSPQAWVQFVQQEQNAMREQHSI